MSHIIDVDPISGITETFDYHAPTDSVILGYHQDVEPILEWNKRRKLNIDKNKCQHKRDLLLYARVPTITQYDMLTRYGVRFWDENHRRERMRLLNTTEYEYCRISHWKHDR